MTAQRAGVFVSIKEDGRLRGCIGTIQAVQDSIAEEIIANAVSASTKDPRFSPIEPTRYGVIVTKGRKRGLLLPNLEGIDTVEDQIAIAKRKAGIGEEEPVELERFKVIRHEAGILDEE